MGRHTSEISGFVKTPVPFVYCRFARFRHRINMAIGAVGQNGVMAHFQPFAPLVKSQNNGPNTKRTKNINHPTHTRKLRLEPAVFKLGANPC